MRLKLCGVALMAAGVAWGQAAYAADTFYAGKTITMSTYGSPGDSYDLYLRLLSRHYGRHIAGSPRFIVINQPGGGGLVAMNHAAVLAPQDGTFLTAIKAC